MESTIKHSRDADTQNITTASNLTEADKQSLVNEIDAARDAALDSITTAQDDAVLTEISNVFDNAVKLVNTKSEKIGQIRAKYADVLRVITNFNDDLYGSEKDALTAELNVEYYVSYILGCTSLTEFESIADYEYAPLAKLVETKTLAIHEINTKSTTLTNEILDAAETVPMALITDLLEKDQSAEEEARSAVIDAGSSDAVTDAVNAYESEWTGIHKMNEEYNTIFSDPVLGEKKTEAVNTISKNGGNLWLDILYGTTYPNLTSDNKNTLVYQVQNAMKAEMSVATNAKSEDEINAALSDFEAESNLIKSKASSINTMNEDVAEMTEYMASSKLTDELKQVIQGSLDDSAKYVLDLYISEALPDKPTEADIKEASENISKYDWAISATISILKEDTEALESLIKAADEAQAKIEALENLSDSEKQEFISKLTDIKSTLASSVKAAYDYDSLEELNSAFDDAVQTCDEQIKKLVAEAEAADKAAASKKSSSTTTPTTASTTKSTTAPNTADTSDAMLYLVIMGAAIAASVTIIRRCRVH